ncbi:MAG TPA: TetR/AcrR family transcriptional regulator [Solimonas sp.]|nr:TetR/AcrR family transcriptional regulator [Solimonas sp.]
MKQARKKRPRARTQEAKEALREQILVEAVALFVEEGYAGFSMRKLARRLHFTATALYDYYDDKHDLLLAVIGEGYQRFGRHLVAAGGAPIERLAAIGLACMDFAFANPKLYTLMFIHRPGPLFDLSPATVQERMALLRGVAETVRGLPRLAGADAASVQHAAELFWAINHGLISLSLTIPLFDEKWARGNLQFLLEALRPLLLGKGKGRPAG